MIFVDFVRIRLMNETIVFDFSNRNGTIRFDSIIHSHGTIRFDSISFLRGSGTIRFTTIGVRLPIVNDYSIHRQAHAHPDVRKACSHY